MLTGFLQDLAGVGGCLHLKSDHSCQLVSKYSPTETLSLELIGYINPGGIKEVVLVSHRY